MVVMVATPGFRLHQARELPRAAGIGRSVSDPDRAQRNRLGRDQLVADDAVRTARRLGIQVIEVDGSLGADAVADLVASRFKAYLP